MATAKGKPAPARRNVGGRPPKRIKGPDAVLGRQRRFAEQYVVSRNGSEAAIAAGYSANGAPQQALRLLRDPDVLALIEQLTASVSERAQRAAVDVLRDIGAVRAHCMSMVQGEGGQSMRSPKEALKALELEGKHLGMWTEKIDLSGSLQVKAKIVRVPAKGVPLDKLPGDEA